MIVDAQVHIWSSGPPTVPPHRQVPVFSKDELLQEMDAAGVDAALLHPPGWDPNGNQVALEAARQHPTRLAVLGHFPLDQPESRERVKTWKQQPGMLGLRFALLRPPQRDWWTDGTMDWLWPAAEQAQVPLALLAGDFLPIVARVAERHPGLKLMVDHLGRVSRAQDEAAFANLPDLLALARFPNVAVKASGAPSYSSQPYPYRNIQPILHQIFDAFGPERMFWGTDITRMPCSWRQCVTLFTEELPWLTGRDRDLVMGEAVCNWLDWHPRQAFEAATVEAAARDKEVELTTFGRKTGRPSRRITWITALDGRIYIRSGLGLDRDWPKNLLANGRGMLHLAGQELPVRARHVTDPEEARSLHAAVKQKYNAERPSSRGNEPLTPAEQAVFELLPRG